jgi:hypothetical protein
MWVRFFWQVSVNTWIGKVTMWKVQENNVQQKLHFVHLCNSELFIKWTVLYTCNPFFTDIYFRQYFFFITNMVCTAGQASTWFRTLALLWIFLYGILPYRQLCVTDSVCKVIDGCMLSLHVHCIINLWRIWTKYVKVTFCFAIAETNWLVLYVEVISAYFGNHMNYIHILCG